MDFEIGSNHYRNAANRIVIDNVGQFMFEHNRRYNEMVLQGLIFDQNGTLAAKISESSLALNIRGEFEMRTEPGTIKLLRRENEELLLEVKVPDKDRVQIYKAKLFTGKGRPLEITQEFWKLGEQSHSKENLDCGGNPVELG